MIGLVSCLMVTRDRLELVRRAVHCFQQQSYARRELVVVGDADDGTKEFVNELADARVRHLAAPNSGLTLGELRNFGVNSAAGEFVAQWDDDDWYHPDRLALQLLTLEQENAEICLLERWTLAWPERKQFALSKRRPWEGSMVARKARLPTYPALRRGEDSVFVEECRQRELRICLLDRPDLYIYVIHGRNTYPAEHFARHIFNDSTGSLEPEEVSAVLRKLREGLSPTVAARMQVGPPMPPRPSICVLVPVYNQAQYLFRAISSVIWQLEPQDELVLVDDASTDIVRHAGLDPFLNRILWLRNPSRRGVSFSRNRGIRHSRADWIKFLDADDVLAPFALNMIRCERWAIPDRAMVVSGGCHRIADRNYADYICGDTMSVSNILKNNPTLPSATFVRRNAFLDGGFFDERIDHEEDWELWLRLHERHGPEAFFYVPQPVCYYWIDHAERRSKQRAANVDGKPVRDYLMERYQKNSAISSSPD